jgi:Zn-dependent oligopeptidase
MHTHDIETEQDIETIFNQYSEQIMGIPNQPGTNTLATFGHIVGGYDAQYYGYLWSKVYADDMYSKLKISLQKGGKIGYEYRQKILAWGGSRDPLISLRDFLGRNPDTSAFLHNLGL